MPLTRKEMERVLAEGGSVLYKGAIITNAAELPSVADIAQGDPAQEAAAKSDLEKQVKDLQAQLATLRSGADNAGADKSDLDNKSDLDKSAGQTTPEEKVRVALSAAGVDTPEKLQAASDDDLLKLPGVTKSGLAAVRATAPTST